MYAFDLNFVKLYNPILLNIKSQYNIQDIGNYNGYVFTDPTDSSRKPYNFNNHSTSFFAQCSIRPVGASGFVKNLELAGRYTTYNTPSNSTFGADQHSVTLGLDYWLNWRTVFKLGYDAYSGNSTALPVLSTGLTKTNTVYLQFSIQL